MSTAAQAGSGTSTWKMDTAHSHAQFKVRHMMISNVKGEFAGINGTLELDEADYTKSKVQASIEAASINTREPQRDTHLKSGDFLDVEKFPALTFTSTKISKKGKEEYSVAGDLTIRGVTRPVTFDVTEVTGPAKDPWGNTRIGLEATTKINRKDFGLVWNASLETGGVLVGDEVHITVDAEFVKG
jgi:polyisoprenoid-binding protein YceI